MISDGIDVAINAMVQETQNLYNDYSKKTKVNIKKEDVSSWYINTKFKQVDVNQNNMKKIKATIPSSKNDFLKKIPKRKKLILIKKEYILHF